MKIQVINELLQQAGAEPLSKEQLLALSRTPAGKRFGEALLRFQAGDQHSKKVLSLVAASYAPTNRAKLRALGFQCSQQQLTQLFVDQGASFLVMLDRAVTEPSERVFFTAFMAGLGYKNAPDERSPGVAPYYSFKIFASSGALTVSEARTRGNEYTVQIDAAPSLMTNGRPAYDWRNKIILQLSPAEMLQVLALFDRQIPTLSISGHGVAHDKFAEFNAQEGKYFVRVGQRSRFAVAIPVFPPDAIGLVSLLYKQLIKNDAHLDVGGVNLLLATMSKMWKSSQQVAPTPAS